MNKTRVVYKYGFPATQVDHAEVVLPVGAEVLPMMDFTEERIWFWASVDVEQAASDVEVRHFFLVGTGHKFDPLGARHIASIVQNSGYMKFVWHLFEREQQ